jgi:predicted N-acyltransferase
MSSVNRKNLQESLTNRLSHRFQNENFSDDDSSLHIFSSLRRKKLYTSSRKAAVKIDSSKNNTDQEISYDCNFVSSSNKLQST